MVRTSAWHAVVRSSDQACYIISCKNLALKSRDCVSLVGHGSSVFENWASSFTPHCLCLSDETLQAVGPF